MNAAVHPFLAGLRPTLHIAHRGGSALAPENTMLAFGEAVRRWRTDVLELDVHVTSDGEVVVSHDATLERCTDGTGAIAAHTWPAVARLDAGFRFTPDEGRTFPFRGAGARVPRLAEVLAAFPGLRVNVDLKAGAPGNEERLATVVRAAGAAARVCAGSEEDAVAARLAAALPEACLFYPAGAATALVLGLKTGAPPAGAADEPWTVLDLPLFFGGERVVDAALVAAAGALGRWINVWTVDDAAEMRRCVADRVGGVMTDRPDVLRAVLDEAAGG